MILHHKIHQKTTLIYYIVYHIIGKNINTFRAWLLHFCRHRTLKFLRPRQVMFTKRAPEKNEVRQQRAELPQWIPGWDKLWRQTSPQRILWDTLSPSKHRNFHSERFRPRWYVSEFHDSISQSCWKMRFFAHPALGMHRRPENPPIRLQGTEPLSESVWRRSQSHHICFCELNYTLSLYAIHITHFCDHVKPPVCTSTNTK